MSAKAKPTHKKKSPAEFFAENQNIAGFDNPGKALYTTIRELVENGLDAAETISVLPEIDVSVEEMTADMFNERCGMAHVSRVDEELYQAATPAGKKRKPSASSSAGKSKAPPMYYRVVVRDNGKGMKHNEIPDMLGTVLSSSNYAVKQTRGKFGLGAKMALIWSKKSTGLPIEIRSAYLASTEGFAKQITYCKLDINITKNEPRIVTHEREPNTCEWRGTEMALTIMGNWSGFKARIINYMSQLAVITPYASLQLRFESGSDAKKNFVLNFPRRSEQMPEPAVAVKHHPSSVNDLMVRQLFDQSRRKNIIHAMCASFSSIDAALARRLVAELGPDFDDDMDVTDLGTSQIHQITQLLRAAKFTLPDGTCLSPAGEYNLRLGILKEFDPDIVVTCAQKVAIFEGHPFIVEAAVSLGGKRMKEGISVFRFANRIPLLFEGGGDVVTRTANKRINWNSYKISPKQDKIGVFVSIVSTKIPFKGTGKEYVGDDIVEMQVAVKQALQNCGNQLKQKLLRRNADKERQERKRNLTKYIPDVSRALHLVLDAMVTNDGGDKAAASATAFTTGVNWAKRRRGEGRGGNMDWEATRRDLLRQVEEEELTDRNIAVELRESVEKSDAAAALEHVAAQGLAAHTKDSVFLHPLSSRVEAHKELYHPLCVFKMPTI